MSKAWVILVLVLAVILVGAFLASSGAPDLDDPDLGGRDEAEAPPDRRVAPGTGDPVAESRAGRRRPTLFGRAHVRIGLGDAIGRLQDFVTKEPVAGATLRLTGTGYGGEQVAVKTESAEDGRFQLQSVPAGEGLELEVTVKKENVRTLTGLVVSTQRVEDLGTIWLGEAGTLEGRVVGLNGEGVGGAEVQVLQGIFSREMMVEDYVGFLSTLDRNPMPVARGEGDAAGRFRIEGVPPGPITVIARVPNHHQAIKSAAMTKNGAVGGPVELRVTQAEPIVGRVVTEDGLGFGGARIGFLNLGNNENGYFGRQLVETGPDGSFRVDSPPRARELVAIVAAEGFPTLYSEVSSDRRTLEFTLVSGSRLTLRFVHDDDGEPIPDASIVAMMDANEDAGGGGMFLTGVTDPAGEVEFNARPGVVSTIMLQHREYGSSIYIPELVGYGGSAAMALKGPPKLEIEAGDNAAEIRKLRGVIVQGVAVDEAGRPVAGATVETSGGMFGLGSGAKALTDGAGAYRLAAAAANPLMVSVEASGFVQDPRTRTASFVIGAVEIEHHVTLLRAARVEGQVLGKAGAPAAGIQVQVRPVKEDRHDLVVNVAARTAVTVLTDDRGRFVIEDVAPGGEYCLIGRGEGYTVTISKRFPVKRGGHTVRAPILKLEQGNVIDVEVRDPYGDVVSGAYVDVNIEPAEKLYWNEDWRWRPYAQLMTSASGTIKATGLPDGKVTFTARADGSAPARVEAQVSTSAPPTAPVVVRLRPAITISGTVVDQHGVAVKNGDISVGQSYRPGRPTAAEAPEWVPYQSTRTDRHGGFELRDVPTGVSVSVSFNAEGYRHQSTPLEDGADDLQLVVHKIDPEVYRRQQALQAEMMTLYGRIESAQDEAEREALMQEIRELQREMASLSGVQEAESTVVPADRMEDR